MYLLWPYPFSWRPSWWSQCHYCFAIVLYCYCWWGLWGLCLSTSLHLLVIPCLYLCDSLCLLSVSVLAVCLFASCATQSDKTCCWTFGGKRFELNSSPLPAYPNIAGCHEMLKKATPRHFALPELRRTSPLQALQYQKFCPMSETASSDK